MGLQTNTNYNQLIMVMGLLARLQNHHKHSAFYDTNAQPFAYTGSENIDIPDNQNIIQSSNQNKQLNRVKPKSIR